MKCGCTGAVVVDENEKLLTFRPLSETFIRRSWYSVLLNLDTQPMFLEEINTKKTVS